MTYTPMAFADSLRIGSVEYVAPDKVEVLLDIEAPDAVALNTGTPRPFPRVNGYVLIPSEGAFAVGQIEWITVERSQYPKRKGMQDFGLLDVPYPLRKMSLNPVGQLTAAPSEGGADTYKFRRGIQALPTVGDPVLLPTARQLRSIVESGENRRVKLGTSPLAADAEVRVDPDRLFGRHLAILGNTGSGKSCSVAGLIRWSVEEARRAREESGHAATQPNARFIVLDPNGEYSQVFSDLNAAVFSVEPGQGQEQLAVPMWFWNTEEWSAFTQATPKTQRPTLVHALRTLRDGAVDPDRTASAGMRRFLRTLHSLMQVELSRGTPWAGGGLTKGLMERLITWRTDISPSTELSDTENNALQDLDQAFAQILGSSTSASPQWPLYSRAAALEFSTGIRDAHAAFGGAPEDASPIDADTPRPFNGEQLLRSVEANAELLGVSEHVDTMIMRIRSLLANSQLRGVVGDTASATLADWLGQHLGRSGDSAGQITVIDMSLVPAEVIHIVTAVLARMTLEALQRYRKLNDGQTLPTVLVIEEAHTFVKKVSYDPDARTPQSICASAFEKIAREGRKFGLGLVLSSQRPSELSPTVLSQCNTFLLHRLTNHTDQDLVQRLVPDNLRGLLRDLPSLPSQNAVLLGWASELPVMVQVRDLAAEHRPLSNDPDYWHVWSGVGADKNPIDRSVDWQRIADDWQQNRIIVADQSEVAE